MGIIKEFRLLQKDVSVLKDKSGDDIAATGSGFQNQGTAGFLASTMAGIAHLGCTAYTSNSAIQNAFYAGSVALTADNNGAVDIAVKRGKNKLGIANAGIVAPSNAYLGSQYLSKAYAWLPGSEDAAYAAVARSPLYAIIVPLGSGGGGGGEFAKGEITYVTNVFVTQPDQYTLRIDVSKETKKVAVWQ